MLFIDVQNDRVRSQFWRALQNLGKVLASVGSDLSRIVYLRVFLRDITDEPTVRALLAEFLGADLCAGEIVGATNAGADSDIDVQLDAVALSNDAPE